MNHGKNSITFLFKEGNEAFSTVVVCVQICKTEEMYEKEKETRSNSLKSMDYCTVYTLRYPSVRYSSSFLHQILK